MSTFINEKQDDYRSHRTSVRQAPSLIKQEEGQLSETGRASTLVTEFRDIEENDVSHHPHVKQGHRPVERDEQSSCSDSPRHSILNDTGQTALFVKKVRGKTQIDDCHRSDPRQTRLVQQRGQLDETR